MEDFYDCLRRKCPGVPPREHYVVLIRGHLFTPLRLKDLGFDPSLPPVEITNTVILEWWREAPLPFTDARALLDEFMARIDRYLLWMRDREQDAE